MQKLAKYFAAGLAVLMLAGLLVTGSCVLGEKAYAAGQQAYRAYALWFVGKFSSQSSACGAGSSCLYRKTDDTLHYATPANVDDTVVLQATTQTLTGKTEALAMTADGNITQYMLVKASTTAGRVVKLNAGDNSVKIVGVALNTATVGQSVTVALRGQQTPLLNDGTGSISAGDDIEPSPTQSGYIHGGSTDFICSATSAAAASLGATFNCL